MSRRLTGATGHRAGQAAEAIVAAHYLRAGCTLAAERWRGAAGEIDLVLRQGDAVIFVEVKMARSHAAAALRVSPRQAGRLLAAAAEFLGGEPAGQATAARFDVALVDGAGRVEIVENALVP